MRSLLFLSLGVLASAGPIVLVPEKLLSYEGTSADGVDQFQGIKFGGNTGGENRFTLPEAWSPATGTKVDATKEGTSCPQATPGCVPFMTDIPYQSEDCLNLRIARPATGLLAKKLPVMVYIYGGGSILGSSYDGLFHPEGLIQQSVKNGEPVLYVSANYRIGVFGFASAAVLNEEKTENLGLKDQILALEWVRDNIAYFGGDPDNVTIFGQSFGGISVGFQLTAFAGKGEKLFHKAIMTSGAISKARPNEFARSNTKLVSDALKCTNNGVVDADSIACLRDAPLADVLAANLDVAHKTKPSLGFAAFSPVTDGDIIPDETKTLLEKGQFHNGVPLLVTWAADDGSLGVSSDINSDQTVLDAFASSIVCYTDKIGQQILDLYPLSDFEDQAKSFQGVSPQYFRASRITRDLDPVCPLLGILQASEKYGSKQVYAAELNQTRLTPYWDAWGLPWGVSHLSDVPYFFNEAIPAPGDNSEAAMALSAIYTGSFVSFANSGNPNHEGQETFQGWPVAATDGSFGADLFVIGGEHETGPATTRRSASSLFQKVLGKFGAAVDHVELRKRAELLATTSRQAAVDKERLAERCSYLNSLNFI